MTTNEHRAPWACVYAKDEGDACHPGEPPTSDREYFEVLCLCLLQAGLNWSSVRKHWPRYRKGFLGFDPKRLARAEPERLLESPDVIRNGRKVQAIVHNAGEAVAIAKEFGSFAAFVETLRALPEAEALEALRKRFKGVGPETADYFLHSVGVTF
jgi:DNA-3-methyladenine glycosylase I